MKFEKTYLSKVMTRAMATQGMPIGDPTGGPAYGERRDPVSAIIAVASMWEAGTIIAGASSLMAGFEALTVAQGLMFAGGALNLVGNATGNKDLMILGSAVTLTGGLGGFMSDAGSGFNQTFSEAFTQTPSTATASLTGTPVNGGPAVGPEVADVTTTTAREAAAANNPASQSLNSTPSVTPDIPAPAAVAPPLTPATAGTAPLGGFDSVDVQFNPAQVAANSNATPANTFGKVPGSSQVDPGIIDKAMVFAKENPMAAMVLGQAASGVATGVMDMASGKTAAQTDQLKADAAYRRSIADKTNRDSALQASRIAQLNANLKAQYPQMNVNQNAVTVAQQQPAGLIASARG